jgi:hypothetical protein
MSADVTVTGTCNNCRHCRKALWKEAGWVSNKVFGTCMHEELKGTQFVYRGVPLGASCPMHSPGEPMPIPEPKPVEVKCKPWWRL